MGGFWTESYDEIAQYADIIETAYRNNKIEIHPGTPIYSYITSARKLRDSWRSGEYKTESPDMRWKTLIRSIECMYFGMALKALGPRSDMHDHLKKAMKGYLDPSEDSHSVAKDFVFELNIGARLTLAGAQILLTEPDIVFDFQGMSWSIAAKRLNSLKQLEKRYNHARRQILRKEHKGIIALSLDSIFNSLVTPGKIRSVRDQADADRMASGYIETFVRQYEHSFNRWTKSNRVIGIFVSLTTVVILKDSGQQVLVQEMGVNNRCSPRSPYYEKLLALHASLDKSLPVEA